MRNIQELRDQSAAAAARFTDRAPPASIHQKRCAHALAEFLLLLRMAAADEPSVMRHCDPDETQALLQRLCGPGDDAAALSEAVANGMTQSEYLHFESSRSWLQAHVEQAARNE